MTTLAVAPMLDYTDRHYRYFVRIFCKNIELWTEMVTASALLHGRREQLLTFHPIEQPLVLQLGGCNAEELALAAVYAREHGYQQLNLNVGCPSAWVQSGRFGACLMQEPLLVAECVQAMQQSSGLPVSVKTRIGVDNHDSYEFLCRFIDIVAQAGCTSFVLHARKAWLQGLSPKQNRTVPQLNYPRVYEIKKAYPHLHVSINGGITQLEQVQHHLAVTDSVMIGRAAYNNPHLLMQLEQFYYQQPVVSLLAIVSQYLDYIEEQLSQGCCCKYMLRHLIPLLHGYPGAKKWRQCITAQPKTITSIATLKAQLLSQVESIVIAS